MANLIKLKRSAVPGKVPLTTDLELGELALNTYDGKLYTKKDNGTVSIVDLSDGINYTISTTPPNNPLSGAKWFNTNIGVELTYIDDGDSSQWIDTSSGSVNAALNGVYFESYELDDISAYTDGVENTFPLRFNYEPVGIYNPFNLLVSVNGIIQSAYLETPDYSFVLGSYKGYTIDSFGNIKFSQSLPANSTVILRVVPGTASITRTRFYPFTPLNIQLGS